MQAVQKLLSQLQGQPCFEQVAKNQALNFEKILNSCSTGPLVAEEAVALNGLVISSAFPQWIKDQLMTQISQRCGAGGGERSARVGPESNRVKRQDFQTFSQYLSVDSWHTLGSASVAECAKLELLVGAVLGLGGA